MKISLEWLSDYLTWTEKDPTVIAETITRSTAEVEEIDIQGTFLDHCCVGEVLTIAKHPSADRLLLVDVQTDQGQKRVVCGGTNLKEGMKVAFAHIGATVKWHGGEVVKLEPVKIRGEKSEGMICAAEELEIEHMFPPKPEDGERPVANLGTLKTGTSLREALGLNDVILHFSNTAITARPDLFSHQGFARECIALGLASSKEKREARSEKRRSFKKTASEIMKISIDCPDLVPRYLAVMLTVDELGETPDWMKNRLQSIGIRSINVPVDITNYVMNDIGVPMHSFDVDDCKGTIHMRLSTKGETLTTLDDEKRKLPEQCIVLSDDTGVFDLVGIMGGLRSSTKETTKHILLHALSIDPVTIRRAIIGAGLRTDASTVYEKGVPPVTTEAGFYRALELFLELVPGATITSDIFEKGDNGSAPSIPLSCDNVRATLGVDIADEEIVKILENLECTIKENPRLSLKSTDGQAKSKIQDPKKSQLSILNSQFAVTPPLHRLRDLTGPHDLIEEIGRMYGYDNVPSTFPYAPLVLPPRNQGIHRLREALAHEGYWELTPLSFVSPDLLRKCNLPIEDAVHVKNPIGEETSLLQTHPLPQLLAHAERMLERSASTLCTFQCSNVFDAKGNQTLMLGMLFCAKHETTLINNPFLTMKGDIEKAIAAMGHKTKITSIEKVPFMAHPGRTAELFVGETSIGEIYEIHPTVRKQFGLPHRAAAVTVRMSTLQNIVAPVVMQAPLAQFPAITYDVTIKRTVQENTESLLQRLRGSNPLLESVTVQDIYEGKPLAADEYNLTLRFVYRANDRTLTEAEAKAAHEKILTILHA